MSRRTSPKTGASPRGGHRTRRRILAAALRLFSRNGFHGTSIRGLARSVGLTEASIYYHFPSKRAIVEALYEQRGIMTALDELEHLPGEVPLDRQLVANALASAATLGVEHRAGSCVHCSISSASTCCAA